jgi:hypothetical protein
MVTDKQILRLRQALHNGMSLSLAAAKAGLDRKTARKDRLLDKLPSEMPLKHDWRTRDAPFEEVWSHRQDQGPLVALKSQKASSAASRPAPQWRPGCNGTNAKSGWSGEAPTATCSWRGGRGWLT